MLLEELDSFLGLVVKLFSTSLKYLKKKYCLFILLQFLKKELYNEHYSCAVKLWVQLLLETHVFFSDIGLQETPQSFCTFLLQDGSIG